MSQGSARLWRSVGTRLAVTTAMLVLLVASALYFVLMRYQRQLLLKAKSDSASMVVSLFAELVSAPVLFADEQGIKDSIGYLRSNPELVGAAVFARNPDGSLGDTLGQLEPRSTRAGLRPREVDVGHARLATDTLDVSQWVRDPSGRPIAVAALRFSLARENRSFALLSRRTQQISAATAAGVLLLLLLLARLHIIGPLRSLRAAVQELSSASPQSRATCRPLPLAARDELGDLARGFVSMTEAIARREAAIATQNAEMRLVLENVGQGFLVLGRHGVIEGQHSAVVERWFGPVAAGEPLWSYLRAHDPEQAEWLELAWLNLDSPLMPLELCVEQMPRAFGVGERRYEITYRPILDQAGGLDHMVVVISDVTELRLREEGEREQRELVALLGAFVRDRAGFIGFCEEAEAWLEALAHEGAHDTRERLEELHTLKGNAWVYQLRRLAETAEAIEASCGPEARLPDAAEVARLADALARDLSAVRPFLGQNAEHNVQLSADDFGAIERALRDGEPREQVLAKLSAASAEPAEQVFARFATRIEILARRLGKARVEVACDGAGLRFPRRGFAPLWSTLVHALRNIADHGLETAWEREQGGKSSMAHVRFSASVRGAWVRLELGDDGRGIDWNQVRARAEDRGLPHQTRAQLIDALLHHGFTTLSTVTALSGRGVGLSAVANEVRRLGGSLTIDSEPGRGTTLVIELPRTLLAA
ncbi:MAG TPA: ATP-binding protein [Polyangiales bacterium]